MKLDHLFIVSSYDEVAGTYREYVYVGLERAIKAAQEDEGAVYTAFLNPSGLISSDEKVWG